MCSALHTQMQPLSIDSYLPVHLVGGAMPAEPICSCLFCRLRCALRCQFTLCDARRAGQGRQTILRLASGGGGERQRAAATAGVGRHVEIRQAQRQAHQQGEFWELWSQELQNSLGLGALQPTQVLQRL